MCYTSIEMHSSSSVSVCVQMAADKNQENHSKENNQLIIITSETKEKHRLRKQLHSLSKCVSRNDLNH